MNYRHIYHAGNFADIFKHIVLTLCLEKLHEKTAPFFALDTHAGIGKYDLSDERVSKTGEASQGIQKILAQKNFSDFLPPRYLKILGKLNCCEVEELPKKIKFYTGSPLLIKDYLRSTDRAIFTELNRPDFLQLGKAFAGNRKITLLNEDGFKSVKSKLPPIERRGLIIIDPAFDKDQSKISADYEKIITTLEDSYKRFATGIYLVWHPIIKSDEEVLKNFYQKISATKFPKILQSSFDVGCEEGETKMHACGMFIFNAPWQLEEKLNEILPQVLKALQKNAAAKFEIKTIR